MSTLRAVVKTVRVVIVQPQTLLRQGMVGMLEEAEDLHVVAHTSSIEDGARLVRDFRPDVVILDLDADANGSHPVAAIKETVGGGRILAIADRATDALVERALADGADGYTLKATSVQEFVDAVYSVARGELTLHPAAAGALARSFTALSNGHRNGGTPQLTPRQREIVELLVQGLQNKQIARRLDIGVETVKTHISRILDRLGVASRTEAVVVALRDGLVA